MSECMRKTFTMVSIISNASLSKNNVVIALTATTSNRSQKCRGRRPHFPFGGLLAAAEIERLIL